MEQDQKSHTDTGDGKSVAQRNESDEFFESDCADHHGNQKQNKELHRKNLFSFYRITGIGDIPARRSMFEKDFSQSVGARAN